ncbi:MAG: aminopeptidase, partial [Bacteroidales bacterium]|nr:aminopeptidase [Bacteroidales bacterium]
SVFNSYYDRQNRMIEPWVLKSLLLLHHPHWGDYSVKYIYPSLELMPELQRTGDIFFPKSWCKNTLHHHYSVKAKESVLRYLENTPDLLPLLENKILQASFHLGIK